MHPAQKLMAELKRIESSRCPKCGETAGPCVERYPSGQIMSTLGTPHPERGQVGGFERSPRGTFRPL